MNDVADMDVMSTLRLWQLISPALPVGAYAYSGGLESAVEADVVTDFESCARWLTGLIETSLTYVDIPLFVRLYAAWAEQDTARVDSLNQSLQAMRESKELRAEDRQMGAALQRLLQDTGVPRARSCATPSFATMYALACQHWDIKTRQGAQGLCWAWVENQVCAAIKLIPLGQTDGQRLLGLLMPRMACAVSEGFTLSWECLGRSLPGLAIISTTHERQYSRLFRS